MSHDKWHVINMNIIVESTERLTPAKHLSVAASACFLSHVFDVRYLQSGSIANAFNFQLA